MTLPARKSLRLKDYDYSTPGGYFLTICTEKKRCIPYERRYTGLRVLPETNNRPKMRRFPLAAGLLRTCDPQ